MCIILCVPWQKKHWIKPTLYLRVRVINFLQLANVLVNFSYIRVFTRNTFLYYHYMANLNDAVDTM